EQTAEEVATDVFERLFRRITNDRLPPVQPDEKGSFRPYIHQVVIHMCRDYNQDARERAAGLTDAMVARLADPESVRDLGDRLAEREILDMTMDRYADRYRAAVRELKGAPQFDPRTFQIFLRVYRDGKRARDVDAEF